VLAPYEGRSWRRNLKGNRLVTNDYARSEGGICRWKSQILPANAPLGPLLLVGICKELRPEARPVAVQPGLGSAPRVRRSWRTRYAKVRLSQTRCAPSSSASRAPLLAAKNRAFYVESATWAEGFYVAWSFYPDRVFYVYVAIQERPRFLHWLLNQSALPVEAASERR